MSARNYILSARERNIGKLIDYLPQINQQKLGYRSGQDLPTLSANASSLVNRNLNYSYKLPSYISDSLERAGTPFSDFFSESETGTPDFHSEESDSSAGSALRRNTAEASKTLSEEWDKIERTLYDEDGEKSTRPQILDECKQWRQLHPQLRIVGKAIPVPERRLCYRQMEHEEIIAMHYSDYEQFSESEERLSQSSTDVTPQNSPRVSIADEFFESKLCREKIAEDIYEPKLCREKIVEDSYEPKLCREKVSEDIYEPKLYREKVSFRLEEDLDLPDSFCSLLHITPIQIRSPSHRKRSNQSILRSDLASSRWMRNSRPDSSIHCERNSAKSFVSLDTRNYNMNGSNNNRILNARVLTARHRELARLEPLYTPDSPPNEGSKSNGYQSHFNIRKVSLPPLLLEEEKRKVSAKKPTKYRKTISKGHLDKYKHT